MKKLLAIVVLGLLLSGNAYANKEKANSHGGAHEFPESARPNDATISLFEVRKKNFIDRYNLEVDTYDENEFIKD